MIIYSTYRSSIGEIVISSDGRGICGLSFGAPPDMPGIPGTDEHISSAVTWLDTYFSGTDPSFVPRLSLDGTPFQMEIWEMLLCIPFGETRTYGQLAAACAKARGIPKMSARAVGNAAGKNPVALIVPCHRLIGAGGALGGYGFGTVVKAKLLVLEGHAVQGEKLCDLFSPS